MAYIGLQPQQKTLGTSTQQLSGNNVDFEFTLSRSVSKAADILVFVDGNVMEPEVDYTASGRQLLFTTKPSSGTNNINVSYKAGALATYFIDANSYPIGSTTTPSIRSTDAASTGLYFPSTTSVGVTVSGNTRLTVTDSPTATSTSTGAVRIAGGVGVTGALYTGGVVRITDATDSVSSSSGALVVTGGLGVGQSAYIAGGLQVGGDFTVAGQFTTTGSDSLILNDPFVFLANANPGDNLDTGFVSSYNDGSSVRYTGLFRDITDGNYKLFNNLLAQPTTTVDTGNVSFRYANLIVGNITATNIFGTVAGSADINTVGNLGNLRVQTTISSWGINYIYSTQAASSTTTGALQVSGGAGIAGNLYAGNLEATNLTGTIRTAAQPSITSLGNLTSLSASGTIQTTGLIYANATTNSTSSTTGALVVAGGIGLAGNVYAGGIVDITSTAASTSTSTGALIVDGGAGIAGNVNAGNVTATNLTGTVRTAAQPSITSLGTLTSLAVSNGLAATFAVTANSSTFTDTVSTSTSNKVLRVVNNVQDLAFSANLGQGSYNNLVGTQDAGIIFSNGTQGQGNLTIGPWISGTSGIRIVGSTGQITVPGFLNINSNNNATAIVNGGTAGAGNIGASGQGFNIAFLRATSAQYADVAERYLADADYEPGTVLHFGGEQEVSQCNVDHCVKIAGVVSTNPAYIMNDSLQGEHVVDLALLGRVPCKVQGPVSRGDMMVSAGNGRARAEVNPKLGAVIGKALQDFDGEQGVIEVVVGRI